MMVRRFLWRGLRWQSFSFLREPSLWFNSVLRLMVLCGAATQANATALENTQADALGIGFWGGSERRRCGDVKAMSELPQLIAFNLRAHCVASGPAQADVCRWADRFQMKVRKSDYLGVRDFSREY